MVSSLARSGPSTTRTTAPADSSRSPACPTGDSAIKGLADVINGRVVASDVGHNIGGGFGDRWIQIPGQIRIVNSIMRLLEAS